MSHRTQGIFRVPFPSVSMLGTTFQRLLVPCSDEKPTWKETLLDLGILLIGVVAYHYRFVFTSATPPVLGLSDLIQQTMGVYQYTADSIASGVLPLWNPYVFGGYPHLALGYSGVFYLPNVIYAFGSFPIIAKYDVVFHMYLATAFAYFLGRDLLRYRISALFFAALFFFAPPMSHLFGGGHLSMVHTVTYLPLLFLFLRRVLVTGRYHWMLLFSVFLAIQILAGYVQIVIFELIGFGVYVALDLLRRGFVDKETWSQLLRKGSLLLLGVSLGLLLAGAQLAPSYELLAKESVRSGGLAQDFFARGSLNTVSIELSLQWADMDPERPPWGVLPIIGPFVIALALFGLTRSGSWEKGSIAVTAVFMLVYCFGVNTPLFDYVYRLPVLGAARSASRMLYVFSLFFHLLTALGVDALFDGVRRESPKRLVLLPLYGALIALMAWPLMHEYKHYYLPFIAASYLFALLIAAGTAREGRPTLAAFWIAGCLLFEAYRSFAFGLHTFATVQDYEPSPEFLETTKEHLQHGHDRMILVNAGAERRFSLNPQIGATTKERMLAGYGGLILDNYARFWTEVMENPLVLRDENGLYLGNAHPDPFRQDWIRPRHLRYLDMLNVKFIVARQPGSALLNALVDQGDIFRKQELDQFVVYMNNNAMPIAYLLHDTYLSASPDMVYQDVKNPDLDLRKTAVLANPLDVSDFAPATEDEGIRLLRYEAHEVELALNVTTPGLLVLTDVYYPGWRAIINDEREEEVVCVNGILRGVIVKPGDSTVVFVYRPDSFRHGLILSGLGAAICILLTSLLSVHHFTARRRRSR